jgi:hypothetical protein
MSGSAGADTGQHSRMEESCAASPRRTLAKRPRLVKINGEARFQRFFCVFAKLDLHAPRADTFSVSQ